MKNYYQEEWREIKEYEGIYQVSNKGRVKVLPRYKTLHHGSGYWSKEKVLKPSKRGGYCIVVLRKDHKRKTYSVHRLVAQAFIPNPENKEQVNHKNGIRDDNDVQNLEWNTCSENIVHSYQKLNRASSHGGKQNKYPNVCQLSLNGFLLGVFNSLTQAQRKTGVSRFHISEVVNGSRQKAGGFLWI